MKGKKDVLGYRSKLHQKRLPEKKLYKCGHCSEKFLFASSLHEHEKTHSSTNAHVHLEESERIEICVDNSKVSLITNKKRSEQLEYACTDCDEKFKFPNSLLMHKKLHVDKKILYDCDKCDQKFSCHNDLLMHTRSHTGGFYWMGQSSNLVSGDVFSVFPSLSTSTHKVKNIRVSKINDRVVKAEQGHPWIFCKYCNRKFQEDRYLRLHMRVHKAEMPYFSSGRCDKKLGSAMSSNKHSGLSHQTVADVKESDADPCEFDQQQKTFRERFEEYIASHAGKKTNINTKLVNSVDALKPLNKHSGLSHQTVANVNECKFEQQKTFRERFEEKLNECDDADPCEFNQQQKTFRERFEEYIAAHTRKKTNMNTELMVNNEDALKPLNNNHVSISKNIHEAESYNCKWCNALFLREILWRDHMRSVHFGKKLYSCDQCDAKFTNQTHLFTHKGYMHFNKFRKIVEENQRLEDNHLSTHGGKKISGCDECEDENSSRASTLCHQKTEHTPEAFYTQTVNEKSLIEMRTILGQSSSIDGENMYNCNECRKTFSSVKGLKIHGSVHKFKQHMKIYNCRICRRRFPSAKGLKIHFAFHSIERLRKRRLPVTSNVLKIKSGSAVKIHACDQCSDFFVHKHVLQEHVATMHCDVKKDNYDGKPQETGMHGDHTAVIVVKPVDCNECEVKCEVFDDGTSQFENHPHGNLLDNEENRAASVEQEQYWDPADPSGTNLEMKLEEEEWKPFGCGKCCASFARPEEAVACFYNHSDI